MFKKEFIEDLCKRFLSETQFVVEINISLSNDITVFVDDLNGLTIDECTRISSAIEENLDREKEDFSLEVGSPGLLSPFKVKEQYLKNIGRQVEVLYTDGEKIEGELLAYTGDSITIETSQTKKVNNKKVVEKEQIEIERINIKTVKSVISFK